MAKIVHAVGTASAVQSRDANLAKRIEKAMSDAVMDALAEGIPLSDTATILARKQAARQAVKDEALKQSIKDEALKRR